MLRGPGVANRSTVVVDYKRRAVARCEHGLCSSIFNIHFVSGLPGGVTSGCCLSAASAFLSRVLTFEK